MANVNANQPPPQPAWRAMSPLNLTPPLHDLPQAFDKMLSKFEPSEGILVHDHLHSFDLAIKGLLDREHEDVVCRLFPQVLKGKAALWYFALPANSIKDWNTFERMFRSKYAVQKNSCSLNEAVMCSKERKKRKIT